MEVSGGALGVLGGVTSCPSHILGHQSHVLLHARTYVCERVGAGGGLW